MFLDVFQLRSPRGKKCIPSGVTDWKTLEEAKEKCTQEPSCSMFYDICGNERGFLSCEHGSTIVNEPNSNVCFPTVSNAAILYSRG